MKLESTNVTIIANEKMGEATICQNGRHPCFIREEYLEELKDLLNDYLELKR